MGSLELRFPAVVLELCQHMDPQTQSTISLAANNEQGQDIQLNISHHGHFVNFLFDAVNGDVLHQPEDRWRCSLTSVRLDSPCQFEMLQPKTEFAPSICDSTVNVRKGDRLEITNSRESPALKEEQVKFDVKGTCDATDNTCDEDTDNGSANASDEHQSSETESPPCKKLKKSRAGHKKVSRKSPKRGFRPITRELQRKKSAKTAPKQVKKSTRGSRKEESKINCISSESESAATVQDSPLCCKLCGNSYQVIRSVVDHLKDKHKDDPQYDSCMREMLEMRRQQLKHRGVKFKCPVCREDLFGVRGLQHVRNAHADHEDVDKIINDLQSKLTGGKRALRNYPLRCGICGQGYSVIRSVVDHLKDKHKDDLQYDACMREMLEMRRQRHKPKGVKLDCPVCGETLYGARDIPHVRNAHPDLKDVERIIADLEYKLSQGKARQKHEKEVAMGREFICEKCAKVFKSRVGLSTHCKYRCVQNPDKKDLFYCSVCSSPQYTKADHDKHMLQHQQENTRFVCDLCGNVYCNRAGLLNHTRSKHQIAKSKPIQHHVCHVCNKSFYFKAAMKRHMSKHSDDFSLSCDVCCKGFKEVGQLRRHKKQVHQNKYPYYCQKCGHGMDKRKYLDSHICGRVRRKQTQAQNPNLAAGDLEPHTQVQENDSDQLSRMDIITMGHAPEQDCQNSESLVIVEGDNVPYYSFYSQQ